MKYELVIFDLDETLLNFHASEKDAFSTTVLELAPDSDLEAIYQSYWKISRKLWGKMEEGRIEKDVLKVERFARTFEAHGISADPAQANANYLSRLPEKTYLMEHAEEVCKALSQKVRLGIITNGLREVQYKRLENSGLASYFDFMVVSDDAPKPKPHPEIFEFALEKAAYKQKSKVLMVGDSLKADIMGSNAMGFSSCWYNPKAGFNHTQITPRYEIRCLREIDSLVFSNPS